MTSSNAYRKAVDAAKVLTRADLEGARSAISKNFGVHATPLPGDQFTGMFSEYGDRAWAHRLIARHESGSRFRAADVKKAYAALKRPMPSR